MEEDLKLLRSLCDESTPREQRLALIDICARHVFAEPEHQVVFESVRAVLARGPVTAERLIVHLTNRGFPDVDIEKYIPAP